MSLGFTMVIVLLEELNTATGEGVVPVGREVLLIAAATSRYPAPIVKMS